MTLVVVCWSDQEVAASTAWLAMSNVRQMQLRRSVAIIGYCNIALDSVFSSRIERQGASACVVPENDINAE
jgi:hypothetical protein